MKQYLCVDAGGSKCSAIWFDERFTLLGRGLSGGINTNTTTREDCRANVRDCLDQLFAGHPPERVEKLFVVFVGPRSILEEELALRTRVMEIQAYSEGYAGLLAGGIRREGILAMAGTGSDIFYYGPCATPSGRFAVGGWGPLLGDQGSGTWIGHQAALAAVKAHDGWGKPTRLVEMIREEWSLDDLWGMVSTVYPAPSPMRKIASLTPLVGRAARLGDEVALSILRDAGELLAEQTKCLIRREGVPEDRREAVCCGGAWKAHPAVFERYRECLDGLCRVEKPYFEHVMAGAVDLCFGLGMEQRTVRDTLEARFPQYAIQW